MSLQRNLMLAEAAVKYANDALWGRSSNRPEDIAHSHMRKLNSRFPPPHSLYDIEQLAHERQPQAATMGRAALWNQRVPKINGRRDERRDYGEEYDSASIIRDKYGNCFEHAVLACAYLSKLRTAGVHSYLVNTDYDINHTFVIIDALPALDDRVISVTREDASPLGTATTVVCDAWWHDWYPLADWQHRMWPVFQKTMKIPGLVASPMMLFLVSEGHMT